MQKSLDFTA